ncbi:DUF4041 domain-containing protein [Desulfoluna sp.]|uniref:DUF4041 domain-containing protein n=1 Tax=Desulfoluna sp. TaxID=2045199 RepID=UPI0026025512|nr:DUF4041 domain-containing protein [Desulfoluna sp.]
MNPDFIAGVVVFLIVISPFIAAFLFFKSRNAIKRGTALEVEIGQVKEESQAEIEKLKEEYLSLEEKTNPLWQYQGIEDAKIEAERIKSEAEKESVRLLEDIENRSNKIKQRADQYAKEVVESAKQKSKKSQEEYDTAIKEAVGIVQSARTQAEEVAGDALKAVENAKHYEQAAKAMKNIIKGYGDEYIIPNKSLLDELAEEFSHKEAGVELKDARQKTKRMIKNGIAAACDYVETHRKGTAVRFVLDAFNGKVDTTLSKVKHDNFGKLNQEILDAFSLVNHNGEAFRNARILPDYRDARVGELEWAVKTNELKLQEREEQRLIKESMREEEKARKEYERAIKQAEKEEKILQAAMEKARKELENANDEQRLEFEQKLADLQLQLKDAEAKNQRALSMAQQTRRGHVYVISNVGSFGEDVFKIGLTRRLEPLDRVKELGDASVPFAFDVHAMIHSEDAPTLEKELHRIFMDEQVNKVNSRKEFFRVGIKQIRTVVEKIGLEAHWTMAAEAQEYRESLALEAVMKGAKEPRTVEAEHELVS